MEVTLGDVLKAATVIIAAGVWLITNGLHTDQNTLNLAEYKSVNEKQSTEFKQAVTGQVTTLKDDLTKQITDVRQAISNLPDQRAQLNVVKDQITDITRSLAAFDGRLGAVERTAIQVRSDLDNITRTSSQPIPGTRSR